MKSNVIFRWCSFVLFYALVVTLVTYLFLSLPVLIQMEYAIYDPIQKWFTIDSEEDLMFPRYAQDLNGIYGINLDDSFFVAETSRVDRKRLSTLLSKLQADNYNLIFLDFLFEPYASIGCQKDFADSLLVESMKPMKDRLIMPYHIDLASIRVCEEYSATHIDSIGELVHSPNYSGFTAPMLLEGNNIVRYHQFRIKDATEISAVHALIEAVHGDKKAKELFENIPNRFEINFVLRNKRKFGSRNALQISNGNQILAWSKKDIKKYLKNKILFIGRFKPKEDHLGNQIDRFNTPVQSNMNGIYFLINAYLNVVNNSYLKKAGLGIVFLVNLLVALLGMFYLYYRKTKIVHTLSHEIIAISIVTILFGALLLSLFITSNIKFPFVISSIAFIKLGAINKCYNKIYNKVCSKMHSFSNYKV